MSHKSRITIEINTDLYLSAKDKLDLSIDEFVEYSMSMFVHNDDEYSKLFSKGCKTYTELQKIKARMYKLELKNRKNEDNQEAYDNAMETVNRIHSNMGYIGKNQLRKIANQNDLNHDALIKYVSDLGIYDIRNFGGLPK